MNTSLVLGLDLGMNNVGWSLTRTTDETVTIESIGTFVFESPLADLNNPGDGFSSGVRGIKRRARRTLARRASRKKQMYFLLAGLGFLPKNRKEREVLLCHYGTKDSIQHPYFLRAKALDEKLTPEELGKVFAHMNSRRGYFSTRDLMLIGVATTQEDMAAVEASDTGKKDKVGPVIKEINQTRENLADFRTLGAYLYSRIKEGKPIRKKTSHKVDGKAVKDDKAYLAERTIRFDRHMLESEFDTIIEEQKRYHPLLTEANIKKIKNVIFFQRPLKSAHSLKGKCSFFPKDLRVARASLMAQKFVIAQDLANLFYTLPNMIEREVLKTEARKKLCAELMSGKDLSWADVKNIANLDQSTLFDIEPISKKPLKVAPSGKKLNLKGAHTPKVLIKIMGQDKWDALGEEEQRNIVGEMLSIPHAKERYELFRSKAYGENQVVFTQEQAANLATASLQEGYHRLGRTMMKKVLPGMLDGLNYYQACDRAKINHTQPEGEQLPLGVLPFDLAEKIGHPLVKVSVRSAIRVINEIIAEFGRPDEIHVEIPRDISRTTKQREELDQAIKEQEAKRKAAAKLIEEAGHEASRRNITKVLLWQECENGLHYEPHIKVSSAKELLDGDFEIDHIVPRSYNMDDSFGNKALCTRQFNQIKKDQLLYDVFQNDPEGWNILSASIKAKKNISKGKAIRILADKLPEGGFTGRHLAATGYISKEVLGIIQRLGIKTVVVSGAASSELRRIWGLSHLIELHPEELAQKEAGTLAGKARSNYKHHALDAFVVSLISVSHVQKVTKWYKSREVSGIRPAQPVLAPFANLPIIVAHALQSAAIVHRPNRKAKGEFNEQTARTPDKNLRNGVPLSGVVNPETKKLVRYDRNGKAFTQYDLGNNHHVVIWESTVPNKKGELERRAEVVPLVEALARVKRGEPAINKNPTVPGWKFVMGLCKKDMVEMEDGSIGVVSKFSAEGSDGVDLSIWQTYAAQQLGKVSKDFRYRLLRNRGRSNLAAIKDRIILNVLGEITFREGLNE